MTSPVQRTPQTYPVSSTICFTGKRGENVGKCNIQKKTQTHDQHPVSHNETNKSASQDCMAQSNSSLTSSLPVGGGAQLLCRLPQPSRLPRAEHIRYLRRFQVWQRRPEQVWNVKTPLKPRPRTAGAKFTCMFAVLNVLNLKKAVLECLVPESLPSKLHL